MYPKPWKSYEDQLDQLLARGLSVSKRPLALSYLEKIGYYRLSGYWYPFRETVRFCPLNEQSRRPKTVRVERTVLDSFRPNSTFQNAVDLYVFDKKLRWLTLDALERIEVALRVDLSHSLGKKGPFAYLDPALFLSDFTQKLDTSSGLSKHHAWVGRHANLLNRSKEDFLAHNRKKYGLPIAVWIACEVWDFGTLSTLFAGLTETDQDAISAKYGVKNGRVFATWVRSLNYLRNVCAHHSRLWNRNIIDQPKLPPSADVDWTAPFATNAHMLARCYLLLRITNHLLRCINPSSTWRERMRQHLLDFPDLSHLDLNRWGMGCPDDWEKDW